MATKEKVKIVDELRDKIQQAKSIFFIDFTWLGGNSFNELRRRARDKNLTVKVIKNTLALRVLEEVGIRGVIAEILRGPTSLILAFEDPVAPARLLKEVKETVPGIKFKGAYLEGKIYQATQFEFLATLPTKEDIRAEIVSVLASPLSELVWVLEGFLGEVVWVLENIAQRHGDEVKSE
ncbi:MAG: 50S ribosomal protein L10 [bacterium]